MAFLSPQQMCAVEQCLLATDILVDIPWRRPFSMFTCKLFSAILPDIEMEILGRKSGFGFD